MTCCAVRWSYFGKANPSGTLNFFNRLRQGNLSSSRMGLARAGSQLYLFENQFGVYSSPSQRCQKYNFLVLKSSLSNFRTNPIGMDQLKLISNDVRIWLSINTKQCDMNKMHICPLNAIRSIFWSTLTWLFLKNVTIEKETGKILRTGVQFLAPVMGLEIAVTAIRSSNFQFTESQAKRLSLEPFYSSIVPLRKTPPTWENLDLMRVNQSLYC